MSLILDGTNGLSDVDGSAATPAIRGSDANTGVFFGTDIVGVSTGGTERMRVDASGNVGIGTSSTGARLDVRALSGGVLFNVQETDSGNSRRVRISNSGTVNTIESTAGVGSTQLAFAVDGPERMRIDSSGNLLVGQTVTGRTDTNGFSLETATGALFQNHVTGTVSGTFFTRFSLAATQIGSISQSGTTAVAYTTSSDYRLKHDIQPMTGALAKVAALKPVTYKWNIDDSQSQGFIAHELQEVVPECVTGEKDAVDADGNPQYQGIDTSFLVATLTAAIQEQQAIITALTARVEALEGAQA